jgi:hypothetical protein
VVYKAAASKAGHGADDLDYFEYGSIISKLYIDRAYHGDRGVSGNEVSVPDATLEARIRAVSASVSSQS